MDEEKIKQFIKLRQQKGDNISTITAFLKSKGVQPTPTMFSSGKIQTGMKGVSQVLGESMALNTKDYQNYQKSNQALGNINIKLLQTIRKNKAEGKDTSRLEAQYKKNTGNEVKIDDIAPSVNKTGKALAGDLMQTAGYLATPLGSSSIAGRVGIGTAMGAISGTGSAMSENKNNVDILAQGLKGMTIGALVSGTFEAVGAGLRGIKNSKLIQNKTSNTYNKELQPAKKDLTKQIINSPVGQAFKTKGTEIRDAVDDVGKPLYVGTYTTILDKAKKTLFQKGDALKKLLGNYDGVAINKNEVAGNIVKEMQDRMGGLNENELKVIQNEVDRIGEQTITPLKALDYKRMYDGKIPDSFWNDTADRTKAIAVQSRYILRDNLRQLINDKTADETVKTLNKAMGLAMDVRRLSAAQIAARSSEKIGAVGGGTISPFKAIYGLIDDTIFNPTITTRTSQALAGNGITASAKIPFTKKSISTQIGTMGTKTGQTMPRKIFRSAIIQKSSKD